MTSMPKSIELIRIVAKALGPLKDKSVFVGGATLAFYLPSKYWPQVRVTEDVDLVLEIISRKQNRVVEEQLRALDFTHDMSEGAPLCRWKFKNIKVDIMSPTSEVFGFTNRWYEEGVHKSKNLKPPYPEVRIFTVAYFMATKIEAFNNRGKEDYLASPDLEDIIAILESHSVDNFIKSIEDSSEEVKVFIKKHLESFIQNNKFLDALPGATFNRYNAEEGSEIIINNIKEIILRIN